MSPQSQRSSGPPPRTPRPRRGRRLEVRISEEQEEVLRQAAHAEDTTVSRFVLETVIERARRVLSDRRDVLLSAQAFDRFIAELDRPAEAVPELVRLFRETPRPTTPA